MCQCKIPQMGDLKFYYLYYQYIYIIIMNEKDITLSFIHYFALMSMKENYYERRIQRRNQK